MAISEPIVAAQQVLLGEIAGQLDGTEPPDLLAWHEASIVWLDSAWF
jgi:hypothetical protein